MSLLGRRRSYNHWVTWHRCVSEPPITEKAPLNLQPWGLFDRRRVATLTTVSGLLLSIKGWAGRFAKRKARSALHSSLMGYSRQIQSELTASLQWNTNSQSQFITALLSHRSSCPQPWLHQLRASFPPPAPLGKHTQASQCLSSLEYYHARCFFPWYAHLMIDGLILMTVPINGSISCQAGKAHHSHVGTSVNSIRAETTMLYVMVPAGCLFQAGVSMSWRTIAFSWLLLLKM